MALLQLGLSIFIHASIIYASLSVIIFFFSRYAAFSPHASSIKRILFGLAGGGISLLLSSQNIPFAALPAGTFAVVPVILTTVIGGWLSGLVGLTVGIFNAGETVAGGVVSVLIVVISVLCVLWQSKPHNVAVLLALILGVSRLMPSAVASPWQAEWLLGSVADIFCFLMTYYLLMTQRSFIKSSLMIKEFAMIDSVTRLNNRKRVDQEISQLRYEKQPFAIGLIDLDDFKYVNDHYGHLVGDQLLFEVADVFRATTRAKDFVGRYGGEEFIIFIRNNDSATVLFICQRIRQTVAKTLFLPHSAQPFNITVSIGVTMRYPEDDLRHSLHLTDLALYEAKKRGKNQVVMGQSPH